METQAGKCARLVMALEDLAVQEAATLHAGNIAEAALIQARAAPLVDFIAAVGFQIADSDLHARIAGLLKLRKKSLERLGTDVGAVRSELQRMESCERTVAQVAPAYGSRVEISRGQFCVRG
jgi:hypothetical protein